MDQLLTGEYITAALAALLVAERGATRFRGWRNGDEVDKVHRELDRKVDNLDRKVDVIKEKNGKLFEWHAPESDDGGATHRFSWKSSTAELVAIHEMPDLLRAILNQLKRMEAAGKNGGKPPFV